MFRTLALGALIGLSLPAMADEKLDAKVEAAIVDTIKLTTSGQLDAWIAKYCDPSRCRDVATKNEMKAYQLKSAMRFSGSCLLEGDKIAIKQKKGEVTDPDGGLMFLRCEGRQLGVPIRLKYNAETDRMLVVQMGF